MGKRYLILALVAALAVAVTGIATAAERNGQQFDITYTSKSALDNTGLRLLFDNEGTKDATGKPKAARKVTFRFPRGTKFDNTVRPYCNQRRLSQRGESGCSNRTFLGSGEADASTGLAAIDPVGIDLRAYNARKALLVLVKTKPGEPPAQFVIKATIRKNVVTATVPKLNQPTPFGEAILGKFLLNIRNITKGDKALVTTPPCPRNKRWRTSATFTYDSGSTTVVDTTRCRA